jgi:site-specific DNA-methyltransferase (adenine-specific)
MRTARILIGDVRARLRDLPDRSVQTVITSPPYWGVRDYQCAGQIGLEPSPPAYLSTMCDVFTEVWRVLRDDGTCWVNLGDSYVRKNLIGIPWRVVFAFQAKGWYLRSDIIWSKTNSLPEAVTDRPTKTHEYLFLLTKHDRYYYDIDAIREVTGNELTPDEYAQRTAPGATWASGRMTQYAGTFKRDGGRSHPNGRNKRSVWHVAPQKYPDAHFATYPEDLIEPCILAGSRAGDVVCDPFCG